MLLITQPRAGTSHNEILALQVAARQKGWDVFSADTGWRLDAMMTKSGVKGVPYGSQTFCEVIAQQMNWKLLANSFDWLAKLPPEYLKRQVDFMTLGEAKKLTQTKFIKPADDKVFPAKMYAPGELVTHEVVKDDTPTLVSDVVQWDLEYRCFVGNDHRVKTWSNYIFYEHIADPKYWSMAPMDTEQSPQDFVQEMLFDIGTWWDAPDCIYNTAPSVIDVGRIPGKGWAIIESNQAWASGIYGCNPDGVLDVLEVSCERVSG